MQRLSGTTHSALVMRIRTAQSNAWGHDDALTADGFAHRDDFVGRAHHAVQAAFDRKLREVGHVIHQRTAHGQMLVQVVFAQRSQHAHTYEKRALVFSIEPSFLYRRRHHCGAPGSVKRHHPNPVLGGFPHGNGYRIWNVVKLEVEEDALNSDIPESIDDTNAVRERQRVADLEGSHMGRQPPRGGQRRIQI